VPWHRLYRRIAERPAPPPDCRGATSPTSTSTRCSARRRPLVVAVNHTAAPVRTRCEGDALAGRRVLELRPKSADTFFEAKSAG
jgi:hypothetical protein